jgi:beta-mannosidase
MRREISMGEQSWLFGQVPRCSFLAANVYDLPAVNTWLPATVPGNVRADLWALGLVPDPYVGDNYKAGHWVETVDWWYRCNLPPQWLPDDGRLFVCFSGIDYLSAIFANGRPMARHEGMFSRQVVEITDTAATGTDLAVRLWGSDALPARRLSLPQQLWQKFATRFYRSWVGVYADRTATLKTQMSFGWDFAPPVRTMGIWDDVTLIVTGTLFITDLAIAIDGNVVSDNRAGPVLLTVTLHLDNRVSQPLSMNITLTPANFEGDSLGPFSFTLQPSTGNSTVRLSVVLPEVMLWQPWEWGLPHLYNLSVIAIDRHGEVVDSVIRRTGFRTVTRKGGRFEINGRPLFLRGVNWVPVDIFPGRVRTADYRQLLTMARESGVNMLRVWGGGLREKRPFYDLCDELGLVVWQEFPFACEFLGTFPQDSHYLSFVANECGEIVRQLQPSPSVIAWCGGNEFSRQRNQRLLSTLKKVVDRYDDQRPFIPVSPGVMDGGDAHNWQVWHGNEPFHVYQGETAQMLSEFGLQALSHSDTLSATMANPPDPSGWPARFGNPQKISRYAALFDDQTLDGVTSLSSQSEMKVPVRQSQLAQAVALQTAIEHMRRRRNTAAGVCLWQFNEPWPAISWAIVDYYRRPKLAFHQLATWYAPILVSLQFRVGRCWQAGHRFKAVVWLINDTPLFLQGCEVAITIDGEPLYRHTVTLPPEHAYRLCTIRHRLITAPQWAVAEITHPRYGVVRNRYPLGWADITFPDYRQRLRRLVAGLVLR